MKKIKVGDLLSLFEPSYIVVWLKGEDDAPVFKGSSFDFPIGFANYHLSADIEDTYALSLRDSMDSIGRPGIVICITE